MNKFIIVILLFSMLLSCSSRKQVAIEEYDDITIVDNRDSIKASKTDSTFQDTSISENETIKIEVIREEWKDSSKIEKKVVTYTTNKVNNRISEEKIISSIEKDITKTKIYQEQETEVKTKETKDNHIHTSLRYILWIIIIIVAIYVLRKFKII